MLPEDSDWHADSGNEEVTHDFINTIQRGVDLDASPSAENDQTYPAPTGTTLPFGGAKTRIAMCKAGVGIGSKWRIDDGVDFRGRWIKILAFGLYNAANKLPGEAAFPGADGMGFDYHCDTLYGDTYGNAHYLNEGAPDGSPPAGGAYLKIMHGATLRGYIFADSGAAYVLTFHNSTGAIVYPFCVYEFSDQWPHRHP